MRAWPLGPRVETPFRLDVPEGLAPGPVELAVGLYDLASGQRLPVSAEAPIAAGDHVAWPLTVVR